MSTEHQSDALTEAHWADIKKLYHRMLDAGPDRRSTLIQHSDHTHFVKQYVQHLLARDGITVALPNAAIDSLLEDLQNKYQSGDQVGVYQLVRPLGQGGMGLVYLADRMDGVYKQQVAIKLMLRHFHTPLERQLFVQERQILAGLQHPHIARLIDGGEIDQRPYLVMEYIEGLTLARYVMVNDLTIDDRLGLMKQLLSAVAYAHQRAVIHKDLKPVNILVDQSGHAYLIDFGIARDDESEPVASVDSQAHTPAYASPEQKDGGEVTAASDVYALGQILRDLIDSAPDASRLSAFRRRQLQSIASRAMASRAIDRYATVTELSQDLNRWQQRRAVIAEPQTRGYRLRTFVQRNWLISIILLASFVLIAVALVTALKALKAEMATNQALVLSRQQTDQESLKLGEVNAFLTNMFGAIETDSKGVDVRVIDVLDRASDNLGQSAVSTPAIEAELSLTLANAYTAIDQIDTAVALLEQAQHQASVQLGDGHEQTWKTREAMISLWMGNSLFGQVRDRGQAWESLMIESGAAVEYVQKLSILIAEAQYWMDEKGAALERLQKARKTIEQQLGVEHPLLSFHDETIAVLFLWDQRAAEAEMIFRRLIEQQDSTQADSMSKLIILYQWLSYSLFEQKQFNSAIEVGWSTIELARKNEWSHFQLARLYNNNATFQQGDGNMTGSIETLLDALKRFTSVLGENHRTIRFYYLNLGDAYLALGDYKVALSWYQKNMSMEQIMTGQFLNGDYRLISQMSLCLSRLGEQAQSRQVLDHLKDRVTAEFAITSLGGAYHNYQAAESFWTARFDSMDKGLSMIEHWHDDAVERYGVDNLASQELLELRLELYQALGHTERYEQYLPQSQLAKRSVR